MAEFLHEYTESVMAPDGTPYHAAVYGEKRDENHWVGWIEFRAEDGSETVRRTREETSQSNLAGLQYWSLGLEPVYLEGALARALTGLMGSGR